MNRLSNLPPGVTESMILGNRPEDAAFENVIDWIYGIEEIDACILQEIILRWCKETGNKPEENPPLQI